jgi:DNA-binding NarL/FixJ family response regulator
MLILASDREEVRRRWQQALSEREIQDAVTLEDLAQRLKSHPDTIAFVHCKLEGLEDSSDIRRLRTAFPNARLVLFADRPDEEQGLRLLRLGVHGYGNTFMRADLLRQVASVVDDGEVWVGWKLVQRLVHKRDQPEPDPEEEKAWHSLTPREREIIALVVSGQPYKTIAKRLDITERTVKAHVSAVLHKLGLKDRTQLLIYLKDRGI